MADMALNQPNYYTEISLYCLVVRLDLDFPNFISDTVTPM